MMYFYIRYCRLHQLEESSDVAGYMHYQMFRIHKASRRCASLLLYCDSLIKLMSSWSQLLVPKCFGI